MAPSPQVVIDLCDDSDAEVTTKPANVSGQPKGRSKLQPDNRWSNGSASSAKSPSGKALDHQDHPPAKAKEKSTQAVPWKVYVPAESYARLTTTPVTQPARKPTSEREAVSRKAEAHATGDSKQNGKAVVPPLTRWRDAGGNRVSEAGSGDELPPATTFITPRAQFPDPAAKVPNGSQSAVDRSNGNDFHSRKRPLGSDTGIANKRRKLDIRNKNNVISSSSDNGPGSLRNEASGNAFGLPRRRKTPPRSLPGPTVDLVSPVKQSADVISISSDEDDVEVISPARSKELLRIRREAHRLLKTKVRPSKGPSDLRTRPEASRNSPKALERRTVAKSPAAKETTPRPRTANSLHSETDVTRNKSVDTTNASTKSQKCIPVDHSLKLGAASQTPKLTALGTTKSVETQHSEKTNGDSREPNTREAVIPAAPEVAPIGSTEGAMGLKSKAAADEQRSASGSKTKGVALTSSKPSHETNGQDSAFSSRENSTVLTLRESAKNTQNRDSMASRTGREPDDESYLTPDGLDSSDVDQGYGSLASNHDNMADGPGDKIPVRTNDGFLRHNSELGQHLQHVHLGTSSLDVPTKDPGQLPGHSESSEQDKSKTIGAATTSVGTEKHDLSSAEAQHPMTRHISANDHKAASDEVTTATNEQTPTAEKEHLSALRTASISDVNPTHSDTKRAMLAPNRVTEGKSHAVSYPGNLIGRVEMMVGRNLQQRHDDNEYWNGVHLRRSRARVPAKPRMKGSPAAKVAKAPFSFASLRPYQLRPVQKEKGKSKVTKATDGILVDKMSRLSAEIPRMLVPVTIFRVEDAMPTYSHAVGIQTNFLAANTTTIQYMPYFGEEQHQDTGSLAGHYDIDTQKRPEKLLRLAQAQGLEGYAENILRDLGLTWHDVLRFFIEMNPDVGSDPDANLALKRRSIFCTEEFPLRQDPKPSREELLQDRQRAADLLISLRPSSSVNLGKAAILCDIFHRMSYISLWHVARKHHASTKTTDSDHDRIEDLDGITCRVCMRLACPYHGEQDEGKLRGEDSCVSVTEGEKVISTDIINPPKVNYRTRVAFPPVRNTSDDTAVSAPLNIKDRRTSQYWHNFIHDAEKRGPFYPCHHPGESCDVAMCTCFDLKLACEKTCACSSECGRKFQGCACSSQKVRKGAKLVCFDDDRCVCFNLGRECDPDLCGACGVCEILDPVNRYNDAVQDGRCRNAAIQRGVPKRTLLGDSGIHGFGLYAGENIARHEFVGEYKGEIITKQEAERRGAVYEFQRLSYLFSLNKTQEIDSTSFGNKIRYINHTPAKSGLNTLYPRIFLVNTVHRIAMYAERKINKGAELLFDYGPQFPNEQLSSNAPHVRNANLVHEDFYDVEEVVDELGNRRARKAVNALGKPRKAGVGAGAVQKQHVSARSDAGRKARKSAPERDENEVNGKQQGVKADRSADSRLQSYNISDDLMADYAFNSTAAPGADDKEDDFEPGDYAEEASETSAEGDGDDDKPLSGPSGRTRTRLRGGRRPDL